MGAQVKITLADEEGTVLDSMTLDRDEFLRAQETAIGCFSILAEMSV